MNQIFIKPVEGRSVRDPDTKEILNPDGEHKIKSGYWLKRIKQGDVVEAKAPKTPRVKGGNNESAE